MASCHKYGDVAAAPINFDNDPPQTIALILLIPVLVILIILVLLILLKVQVSLILMKGCFIL